MAEFKKIKHFGSFGSVGINDPDTLEVNMVSLDGGAPRLHIGRWTQSGAHKKWSGFMSEAQAADLWGILDSMQLNSDK